MKISIYSDGAARGNPDGPGGYGTILQYTDSEGKLHEKELSKGYAKTTNNRMELMGAIAGFEALNRPCEVDLYSDSAYLINAFEKNWLKTWQANGWKTASRSPVKNQDLWERLIRAMAPHQVNVHWVRGHNGHPENERCDRLATSAADAMKSSGSKTEEAKKTDIPGTEEEAVMKEETIKILYHSNAIEHLEYIGGGKSDWIDLRSAKEYHLKKGDFVLIDLGISVKLPAGYEMIIAARSSLFKNYGLIQANGIGVVDESYSSNEDVLMMPVYATRDTAVHVNDRVCQFRILEHQPRIHFEETADLGDDCRGGFGSTGKS